MAENALARAAQRARRDLIVATLRTERGNVMRTARRLGLPAASNLYAEMKRHAIEPNDYRTREKM